MGAGRMAAIALGLGAAVLGLLLLQEQFVYPVVEPCPPEHRACEQDGGGIVCRAPLWAAGQGDERPETANRDRCSRGRAWRWALYGGLGAAGAVAALAGAVRPGLTSRTRRARAPSLSP